MLTRSTVSLTLLLIPLTASAATSPKATTSPFGGNGHNVTFDGRLFIARTSPGWEAMIFRPQNVGTASDGFADVSNGAFSQWTTLLPEQSNENALALCEETPQPTACNQDGSANGSGAYDCYNLVVIDSDAVASAPNNMMRARRLRVVVSNPKGANAAIDSFTWTQSTPQLLTTTLRGIEPSVTKDGKLLVWQGVPANNGQIDTIVYSVNQTPCGISGWSTPKSIAAMYQDPAVVNKYPLAEKQLRGADGTLFTPSQVVYGGYPWIFPSGEAVNFTATPMPCRTQPPNEDPPGCGPRRNALSVIGYPTNWQLAHVDGAVNPDRENIVRLFFSSPGPNTFNTVPKLQGLDVWPFFGSNTQNYTEIIFDDALDGKYGGLWHMNELVTNAGTFDLTRTADSSGYSNTGKLVGGASMPAANNGVLGKAVVLNGSTGRVEALHSLSLNPVNAMTMEMYVKPLSEPDCDTGNNYRLLMTKGGIGNGSYSIVLEENRDLQARVRVQGGTQYSIVANRQLPLNQWSHIAVQYEATTGTLEFWIDGAMVKREVHPPKPLEGSLDKLTIGGPATARPACPNTGDGYFHGELDEVGISRVWRYGTVPAVVVDAGTPVVDAGTPVVDAGTPVADAGTPVVDAGAPVVDAGTPIADAGTTVTPDAGQPVTTTDAGTTATSPTEDAGQTTSVTTTAPPPPEDDEKEPVDAVGGFGCSSGGAPMAVLALIIAARLLHDARRRRRSER